MAAKPKKGKPTAASAAPIPLKLAHRQLKAAFGRRLGKGARWAR